VATTRRDVGLGTAYERIAIRNLLLRWCLPRAPATALEGPADGMAGIRGLHLVPLARRGVEVTVQCDAGAEAPVREAYAARGLTDRLRIAAATPPGRFDVVLSFCALHAEPDWRGYLDGRLALARTAVVIVPNRDGWGVALRRLAARAGPPAAWEHESSRPEVLEAALGRAGSIVDRAFVDAPWWPDLHVEAGDTLAGSLARSVGSAWSPAPRFVYEAGAFPHDGGPPPEDLARALRRHPTLERAAPAVARRFAHHRAYLVEVL
jgi:hypothetical protein